MVCGAIILRIPKTRRNTTTTKHAQINTITHNQWEQHHRSWLLMDVSISLTVPIMHTTCLQLRCRHSQQPTYNPQICCKQRSNSDSIFMLSMRINESSKRKTKWYASWWVCDVCILCAPWLLIDAQTRYRRCVWTEYMIDWPLIWSWHNDVFDGWVIATRY